MILKEHLWLLKKILIGHFGNKKSARKGTKTLSKAIKEESKHNSKSGFSAQETKNRNKLLKGVALGPADLVSEFSESFEDCWQNALHLPRPVPRGESRLIRGRTDWQCQYLWERGWAVADSNWKGTVVFTSGVFCRVSSQVAGEQWPLVGKFHLFQGMEATKNNYYIWLCSSEKKSWLLPRDGGKDSLMKEVWHLFLVNPKHHA